MKLKTAHVNYNCRCRECDMYISITSRGFFTQCAEPAAKTQFFWHAMTRHFSKVTLPLFFRGIFWNFWLVASMVWGILRAVAFVPYSILCVVVALLGVVFDL